MKIKDLLKEQYEDVIVDDVSLKFKKLTWKELKDFEKVAEELDVKSEEVDETDQTLKFVAYLFKNFIRDEDNEVVVEEKDIENLPFTFCVSLINSFVQVSKGEVPSEEEAKKK